MNLKYETARILSERIRAAAPDLNVQVVHGDIEDTAKFPCLAILPRRFEFTPVAELELDWGGPNDTYLLLEAGRLDGKFELRAYSTYPIQREGVEENVTGAFFQEEGRNGQITIALPNVKVNGVQSAYTAFVACRFRASDWTEEMVFSQKRYSYLEIDVSLPLLVGRTGVPKMNSLFIDFTTDLDGDPPVIVEEVQIAEDGTLTRTGP